LDLGNEAKWEYFRVMYERYHKAERKARAALLDEFCVTTRYNRKYAIRLLNGPRPEKERERRRRERKPQYGKQVISVLAAVWEAAGYPWSVRLKAAAELDALDPQTLPAECEVGAATAGHERAPDGPSPGKPQAAAEAENLWAHQTRGAVEAPHSAKDRQLGCKSARLHGFRIRAIRPMGSSLTP